MNKRIDFSKLGGFPLTQFTTDFMQSSYRAAFMAIAALIGEKVILQGVEIVGGQASNGWVVINGELMPFQGGILSGGDTVIIQETSEVRQFDNGNSHPVYFTKVATIGAGVGAFPFSDLKSITTMLAIFNALADLEELVDTHTHSYASLTAKPAGRIAYMGSQNLGNLPDPDGTYTINIPDQGNANYHVFVTVVGNNNNYDQNNDVAFIVYDKTALSFKLGVRELAQATQDVRIEFIIVKAN